MRLNGKEKIEFQQKIGMLLKDDKVKEMERYIQHGNTTTLSHCIFVAYASYWLTKRLSLQVDLESLMRGAMLHDFYLYDWHDKKDARRKLHGFYHPGIALGNAKKHFCINQIEADIIERHMWPLTLTKLPRYRETVIVCTMDKICAVMETFKLHDTMQLQSVMGNYEVIG